MKKEKKVRYLRRNAPCPSYDVERLESWLQDCAAEGLHLAKEDSFFGFLAFERGTPRTVRYRLEPKPKEDGDFYSDRPDKSVQALCEAYGWEFVVAYGQFYIYRALRPDAREMNTDFTVQAEALKVIRRQFSVNFLVQMILMANAFVRIFREPFRYLVTFGGLYTYGFVALMVGALVLDGIRTAYIFRLRKKLKQNIPLDHHKPWKKWALAHRLGRIVAWVFALAVFSMMVTRCTSAFMQVDTPLSDYEGDPPIVTMEEIFPGGEYVAQSMLDYNTFQHWSNSFSSENMEWKQYGQITAPDGTVYSGFMIVDYHETAAAWIAKGLAEDYFREDKETKHFKLLESPTLGLDESRVFIGTTGPVIILRQGNILVRARILIDNAKNENVYLLWAELMAQRLAQ